MASYHNLSSVLDATLGEFKEQGFQLIKASSNILELYFKDKKINTYNFLKIPIKAIQEDCKNYMANLNGGS